MADWTTISALATAGGTLVLACATFASVRSANRSARMAERSLLAGLRPLVVSSRMSDEEQKVGFVDDKWFKLVGGHAIAEAGEDAVYFAISVRNAGRGLAVLDGWHFEIGRTRENDHAPIETFRKLVRDIYIAPGDIGFWQGAFRDVSEEDFEIARKAVTERETVTIELLYSDLEGGQRTISRFALMPIPNGDYISAVGRHWVLDGHSPRG